MKCPILGDICSPNCNWFNQNKGICSIKEINHLLSLLYSDIHFIKLQLLTSAEKTKNEI